LSTGLPCDSEALRSGPISAVAAVRTPRSHDDVAPSNRGSATCGGTQRGSPGITSALRDESPDERTCLRRAAARGAELQAGSSHRYDDR
jgi:hypothetical protein